MNDNANLEKKDVLLESEPVFLIKTVEILSFNQTFELKINNHDGSIDYKTTTNKVEDDDDKTKPARTNDVSMETELHPVESYIDPKYQWNEWTARQEILKYAKLMNCKTKGSQTKTTYFRRDNSSQVYLPKENHSQTKRDTATNPKLTTSYLTGLSSSSNISCSNEKKDKNGVTKVTLSFDV